MDEFETSEHENLEIDDDEPYDENNDNNHTSFYDNDEDNVNALKREEVDMEALSVNPELLGELRGLKRGIYNAVVFGPPVGSEEAQDLRVLQVYESLLLELNNLLASIFDDENPTTQFVVQQFARFPEQMREPACAYCMKVVEFKEKNEKPYLNGILEDHFDRMLKEHPY